MSSKTPYLIGGSILLAAGAYYLYAKGKASTAAPATAAALPTGAAAPASTTDLAALSKILGSVPAPAATSPSLGKQFGLADSAPSDAWYAFSEPVGYYTLTAAGNNGLRTALTPARGNLFNTDASADVWRFTATTNGVAYQDLIEKSKVGGSFVFVSRATLDALKVGGSTPAAYAAVVQPANVDAFIKAMKDGGVEPVFVSATYL
jgi:hypothetical protein